jgi:hypothetical protein
MEKLALVHKKKKVKIILKSHNSLNNIKKYLFITNYNFKKEIIEVKS